MILKVHEWTWAGILIKNDEKKIFIISLFTAASVGGIRTLFFKENQEGGGAVFTVEIPA